MNEEIICGIYKITSPSNKMYIGLSPNILLRWKRYRHEKAKRQPKLFASFKKHGVDSHKFEIVEVCDVSILEEREKHFILFYDTFNTGHGLNLTLGGRGSTGCRLSDGTKKKLRDKALLRPMSEETKSKITETLKNRYKEIPHHSKGKKQSAELIAKRVLKNTGKRHTDETKEIMRVKALGNKRWLGKHHKKESKIKQIASLKRTLILKKLKKANANGKQISMF